VRIKICLAWLLLGLIWGSTWLAIKVGLADLPPFAFASARFLIAPLPLAAVLLVRRPPLPHRPSDWTLLAVTAVLSIFLSYGLVFWGEQHISSGLTAILFTTLPLFGLVFAHLLVPSERLSLRKLLGVVGGISGTVLIFGDQISAGSAVALGGSLAVLTAAAAAALSNVLIKARGSHLDPQVIAVSQMTLGAIPLSAMALIVEDRTSMARWTPLAVFCLLYLALIGSALAFAVFYWLIRRIEVTKAQLLIFANTLVAVILGQLILDEQYGWRVLAGGAAILLGLLVSLTAPRQLPLPAAADRTP
jgi:drug/metabolite transporter (DMT)-like permease